MYLHFSVAKLVIQDVLATSNVYSRAKVRLRGYNSASVISITLLSKLMHTTLKIVELIKNFRIIEAAPTCFGLQGNHHQGATASA